MSGGEAVGDAVADWARSELNVTINEIFGQTEMNYVIGGCSALFAPRPGAMGRTYPGHRITLLDEAGAEVGPGQAGEIAVWREGDPVVFLEYWNNPQATRAKFTGGWGRTGDVAVRDDAGFYWYHGRTDDVIKSAGYRIGPAEIEDCLLKHHAVANAAVIGVPDDERGTRISRLRRAAWRRGRLGRAGRRDPRARARTVGALPVPQGDRVHRRTAHDDHRQDPAAALARAQLRSTAA